MAIPAAVMHPSALHVGHWLHGRLTGLRSYRVGAYRIIYELREKPCSRLSR